MAQNIEVKAGFKEDTLGIGEEIHFWLTASYPLDIEILFPDSNYNFSPFEYVAKRFEPTSTQSGKAYDTTVYKLQSFEIDPVQYLQLPVVIFNESDSTIIRSPLDSIYFRELVAVASDTTQLKTNLSYHYVKRFFNYPLMWIITGALALIAVIIFLVYGDKIRRTLKIRKLKKDYVKFSDRLTRYIHRLKESSSPQLAEEAVSYWKKYYEKLETLPISKLTTAEILELEYTRELKDALRSIDRCVYGHLMDESLYRSFQSIEDFTQHRYNLKLEELRHGNRK